MSAPTPIIGSTATLTFNSVSLTAIKITPPTVEVDDQEVTTLSDSNHKNIAGIPKFGHLKATFNYNSTDAGLEGLFAAVGGTQEAFSLTYHDGGTFTGMGYVASFEVGELTPDEPQTVDVEFTINTLTMTS